jgi:hypothetical protein
LFVEAGKDILWASLQLIQSRIFKIVVISTTAEGSKRFTDVELRRLQLAAEKAAVAAVLLTEKPTQAAWAIVFQAEVDRKAPKALPELPELATAETLVPHLRILKERARSLWKTG